MMVPSSLPTFEIPTGLMATGLGRLRGMGGLGRGLGAIDVEPLAQAMMSGGVSPQFLPPQSFQPSYLPAGQLLTLPTWLYATQGFASQIAGFLNGSVTQAPPPGDYQGTGIPLAYWVRLPDGSMLLPGNLFQPGTVLSFPDLCTAENYLTNSIPGSAFGSSCGSYASGTPNPLVGSGGVQAPVVNPPTAAPKIVTAPVAPIVTSPIQVAAPAGTGVSVPNSGLPATPTADPCQQAATAIAGAQASGMSNIVIWTQLTTNYPTLASCPSVVALNPSAYQQQSAVQQPGDMTGGNDQSVNLTPPVSSNTGLYVGLAIAAGLLLLFGGER